MWGIKKVKTQIGKKLYYKFHHSGGAFAVPIDEDEKIVDARIREFIKMYIKKSKQWKVKVTPLRGGDSITISNITADSAILAMNKVRTQIDLLPGDLLEYENDNGYKDASYYLGNDEYELEPHGHECASKRLSLIFRKFEAEKEAGLI